MLKKLLILTILLLITFTAWASTADSPVGLWQTFDDEGKATGYIRISEKNGELTGTVERGLPTDADRKYCTACKGHRKNQRLIGMDILWGLRKDGDSYSGGEILEPFSGNIYRAQLTLLEGGTKLKVRGYAGISLFGRTQIWQREE